MGLDNYQWQSEFALSHIAQGKAESILLVLDARSIPVSDEIQERVTSCTDFDILEQWVRRAIAVETAEQLFD